ncbi:MAG: hypothetical protein AAB480_03415 [Patescibacteria group bacterium]
MLEHLQQPDEHNRSRKPARFRVPDVPLRPQADRMHERFAELGRTAASSAVEKGTTGLEAGVTAAKMLREFMREVDAQRDSPLDRAYAIKNQDLKYPERSYGRVWMETKEYDNRDAKEYTGDDQITVVFLPWDAEMAQSYDYGFIPKWGRSFAVSTPGAFVNKNPEVTKSVFLNAINSADEYVTKLLQENPKQKINVTCYSSANGAGFYIANKLPLENKGRFLSIVSGSGLGREIFASPILEAIKRDVVSRGIPDGDTYNQVFNDEQRGLLLPIHNCESLGDDTVIAIGRNDLYIPAAFGHEIAQKASAANPNIKVIEYPFGHIGTMLYMGHLEHLRHMKSVLKMADELTPEMLGAFENLLAKKNISLPQEDTRLWCAVAQILWGTEEKLNKSRLVIEDPEKRTIRKIADDFFTAVLPESRRGFAERLSTLSGQIRGRVRALQ